VVFSLTSLQADNSTLPLPGLAMYNHQSMQSTFHLASHYCCAVTKMFQPYKRHLQKDGSGVARVQRAPVQRHVVGPLVIKQLSNSFAAMKGMSQCITVVRNTVVEVTIIHGKH